ncbi:MAG: SHOCT domain-containing protein [Lachnospiraceae bacterium]
MTFFDKLKDVKNSALESAANIGSNAKSSIDKAKEGYAQKREAAAALDAEFTEKAQQLSKEIVDGILEYCDGSKGGYFANIPSDTLLKFTKDFYEKLVLPGGKTSTSCIAMHPYIDDKKAKQFAKSFSQYQTSEIPVLYLKDGDKQEILLTTTSLYFRKPLPENPKYFADGVVDCKNIDCFYLEEKGDSYAFKCDTYELAEIKLIHAYKQDFLSLNEYFRCVKQNDLDITNEEIDHLIQEKIGAKIYSDIRKYMTYEDELVLYYAGGLDSMTASDYIACTTKQIIIVNREMFGATANVKQFYYEDISAMSTIQNSNSNDLFVSLVDAALTSALKLCDLEISVAGSKEKISTLNTIEAQRVIAIYHEQRKLARENANKPQIVQQAAQPDVLEQLEKLSKLKESGIISEEEFNQKKAVLLEKL